MWEKNKAVTPSLAFPFALESAVKKSSFSEKEDMHFGEFGIKKTC